eukprot:4029332-Ditylum_brightwellii.AAC.1
MHKISIQKDLPQISKSLASTVPLLDEYLDDYIEALDPDNGIEESYHPKHDKLFTWRAMRLMSRNHLTMFGLVTKNSGDFEEIVRKIWVEEKGIEIPRAEKVEVEEELEDGLEEEDHLMEDGEKKEDTMDIEDKEDKDDRIEKDKDSAETVKEEEKDDTEKSAEKAKDKDEAKSAVDNKEDKDNTTKSVDKEESEDTKHVKEEGKE